jgi:hypothetical protein
VACPSEKRLAGSGNSGVIVNEGREGRISIAARLAESGDSDISDLDSEKSRGLME